MTTLNDIREAVQRVSPRDDLAIRRALAAVLDRIEHAKAYEIGMRAAEARAYEDLILRAWEEQ